MRTHRVSVVLVLACAGAASACPNHTASMGVYDPVDSSIFTIHPTEALPGNATVGAWKLNLTGAMGNSPNATIDGYVSSISADVQSIYYDANFVYIKHT